MALTKRKKERKIDIFAILKALDLRDFTVYEQIAADPEALAELDRDLGYVLPLWMTGSARDPDHVELVKRFNQNCQNWFALAGNRRMQARLLATVGLGRTTPHRFYRVRAQTRSTALFDLLVLDHPDIRAEEIRLWMRKHSLTEALELAEAHGWLPDQIEALRKNYAESA